MKGYRKVIIFFISVAIAVSCSFFMQIEYYKSFLNFAQIITGLFFAGNALSNRGQRG
ncbi:MAG: hypothetical protein GY853_16150 [PVC group bacterium]|nr:hypothetical protein [PVC group bacterium]